MPKGCPPGRLWPRFEERFWVRVAKGAGCWEWMGAERHGGYGEVRYLGRKDYAHRVGWILQRGPIPPGLYVLHGCDNPPCVRVGDGHLFLGTHQENMIDAASKGRLSEAMSRGKLDWERVGQIRSLLADGHSQRDVAKAMGVHPITIGDIARGKSWAAR